MVVEREINLASIVEVMWLRARGILLFTFVTMILAMLATLTISNRYTATAKLMMNKSKLGERTMQNPAIPMNTYLEMAEDEALLQELLTKYNLTEQPFNFEYREDLEERIEVELIQDTSLLEITVQLEEPEAAANIANAIAQDLINKSTSIMELEGDYSYSKFAEQVKNISEEVEAKRKVYENVLVKNQLQLVQNELDANNSILSKEWQETANIESAIAQLEHKADVMENVLSSTDFTKIVVTKNNILRDPLIEAAVNSETEDLRLEQLSQIVFENENVNQDYLGMKREYETLRADLAGQYAMLEDKKARIEELEVKTKELQDKFNRMNLEEQVAKAEFDRTLEILGGIDKEEGWAKTNVMAERQDLFPVVEAIPPDKKSYPQRTLMVAIVGSIAFLLAFMYYLLRDLYGLLKEKSASGEQSTLF